MPAYNNGSLSKRCGVSRAEYQVLGRGCSHALRWYKKLNPHVTLETLDELFLAREYEKVFRDNFPECSDQQVAAFVTGRIYTTKANMKRVRQIQLSHSERAPLAGLVTGRHSLRTAATNFDSKSVSTTDTATMQGRVQQAHTTAASANAHDRNRPYPRASPPDRTAIEVQPHAHNQGIVRCFERVTISSPATQAIMRTLRSETFTPLEEQRVEGPRVIPLQSCWIANRQPDILQIRTAVLKACIESKSSLIATNFSKETCDPVTFLSHLMNQFEGLDDTARWNLLNIDVTDSNLNQAFKIPEPQLNVHCSKLFNHVMQSNLALAGSFVGPHVDHGTSGIAFVVGKCEKLWLVWPPSKQNLGVLGRIRKDPERHKYNWGEFEQGYAAVLTEKDAVYLPSGYIHATITINPGFLLGRTFYEPHCASLAATCLIEDLHVDLYEVEHGSNEGFSETLDTLETYYTEALEVSLFDGNEETRQAAMTGWSEVQEALGEVIEHKQLNRKDLKKICHNIYRRIAARNASFHGEGTTGKDCPFHERETLSIDHFVEHHLRLAGNAMKAPVGKKRKALKLLASKFKKSRVATESSHGGVS